MSRKLSIWAHSTHVEGAGIRCFDGDNEISLVMVESRVLSEGRGRLEL